MFIADRFANPLPKESVVQTAADIPILGKTLGELQDWAVKLNGGDWSQDGQAQLWIRKMYMCLIKPLLYFWSLPVVQKMMFNGKLKGLQVDLYERSLSMMTSR